MFFTNQERITLQQQWMAKTNPQPLVISYARVQFPIGGLDIDIPSTQMMERKLLNLEVERQIPNDILLTVRPEFSLGFLPALCGAGFEYDQHTSWAIPIYHHIQDVIIPPFTDSHRLMQSYLACWEPILQHWSWDTYLPGGITVFGAADLLAGLLGASRLAEEIYDNPAQVKGKAMEAAHWLREFATYEIRRNRRAGVTGGSTDAFRHWLPGDGFLVSEDFSVMISPRTYRNLFAEADENLTRGFDSCFFHIHTVGDQCLPVVLENPNYRAMEISNDINNHDLERMLRGAKAIQARGLPLQVSNWEHPLPRAAMQRQLDALNPHGLLIGFSSENLVEAQEIYHWVKSQPYPALMIKEVS